MNFFFGHTLSSCSFPSFPIQGTYLSHHHNNNRRHHTKRNHKMLFLPSHDFLGCILRRQSFGGSSVILQIHFSPPRRNLTEKGTTVYIIIIIQTEVNSSLKRDEPFKKLFHNTYPPHICSNHFEDN